MDVRKGYHVFNLVTQKILYRRNVVFNEDEVGMVFLDEEN